ncbi:MAG: T9SS type A sorting domain-containing protein [Bacteroidetes bacterium]|nr:T9SS type A sorting domain-containing protein [Bacteroidota bacterium]
MNILIKSYKFFLFPSIFLMLLVNINIHAQTFEKVIGTSNDDVALDAIELEEGGFIVSCQTSSGDNFTYDFMIKLYKLQADGDILDSLYHYIDTKYKLRYINYLYQYDSNKLLLAGNCQNRISLDYQIYVAFTDLDFEFISDTIIGDSTQSYFIQDFLLNEYECLVGTGFNVEPGGLTDGIYMDYNPATKQYRQTIHTLPYKMGIIVELPQINAYHVQGLLEGNEIVQICRDDLSLDTIIYCSINSFSPGHSTNIPGTDKYLMGGRKSDPNNQYIDKISYRLMDIHGEILEEHLYGALDTNHFFALSEMDCRDSNYFYLGGTKNFEWFPPFLTPEPRWIFINKLHMDGSIIWQHYYKGELNYMPYKILASSDGGALILSHKYDWNSPYPNQRDIHILKVDSNGYYSGMVNVDEISGKPLQLLVYPNPTSTTVNIVCGFYTGLDFLLYDLSGKLLLNKKLNASQQSISIDHLPAGMYVYRIMQGEKLLESSRLVVQ